MYKKEREEYLYEKYVKNEFILQIKISRGNYIHIQELPVINDRVPSSINYHPFL